MRTGALMVALLSACVAFQLNASMLSPVLPSIATELGVDEAAVSLSQTAFFTSAALFAVFVPRLSDIKGRRRVLVVTLALVAVGSVLSAVAPGILLLDAGRVIQGCSGSVIAICLLMLRAAVPDVRRYGALMGVVTAVNGGIAGVDVLLGGFLAARFGFRPVFWLMAVVALGAAVLVARLAPESRPSQQVAMDWRGVAPLVVTIGCVLVALNEASRPTAANWVLVIVLSAVALVSFAVFWFIERATPHALASPARLRQRATWALLLTTTLTLAGIFATVNGLVVTFAQNREIGFGLGADATSLLLLSPYALVGWLIGPFAGRLAPRFGYLQVLRVGLAGSVVALALMATAGLTSLPLLIAAVVSLGVAYAGMSNIMLNGLSVVLSPQDAQGFLPGVNCGAFNFGAGLSFAVLPLVQLAGGPAWSSGPGSYAAAIGCGLIITVTALATSYLIPRPTAAEIPRHRPAGDGLHTTTMEGKAYS
ncbi:MFS transporter [Streptosporangium sp. NPDC048047]|uniref:uridine transporter UriT n=1 Tax=Streptosporangium sp. NPDC048047 TaxID=3155748 RepID=UPI0034388781